MDKGNIVLIGFPGTGKSTVGRRLAVKLGWRFIDSDSFIEEREGMTIPEIFARNGEAYFRKAESEAIAEIMRGREQIVATGGGAVLAEVNRKMMRSGGFVVELKAGIETIVGRLSGDAGRPLLHGDLRERLGKLMEERKHAYDFADFRVDTEENGTDAVADLIIASAIPAFRPSC